MSPYDGENIQTQLLEFPTQVCPWRLFRWAANRENVLLWCPGRAPISRLLLACLMIWAGFLVDELHAQSLTSDQENQYQLDTQRREFQERSQELAAPSVHSGAAASAERPPVENEVPCERAVGMALQGPSQAQFQWLLRTFNPFAGKCLGQQSLQALVANLNDRVQAAGYATTKLELIEPSIQGGVVQVKLLAGRIGRFRLVTPSTSSDTSAPLAPAEITNWPDTTAWQMAMPAREGGLLNIRDLDHAAETIQRLGYAIEQYIVPQSLQGAANQPDQDVVHDIVVAWQPPARRWQPSISLDNSSSPAFGRTHMAAQLSVNNLLGLAEQTYLSYGGNAEAPGPQRRQTSEYLSMTVPWGYHRFSLTHSVSQSALGISGTTVTFTNYRADRDVQLEWAYTLYRDAHYKITPELSWGYRTGSSHIEDVEVIVQRRHARIKSAGLSMSWVGPGQQFQTSLGITQTARRHHPDDDFFFVDEPAHATTRRWSGQWLRAVAINNIEVMHTLQWDVMSTRHPTPLSASMSLGGRYTVRGFTGDQTLSASDGLWARNEWQFPASVFTSWGLPAARPYMGVDIGKVWGDTAPYTSSRHRWIAGVAFGWRHQWQSAAGVCSMDIALSTPLHGIHLSSTHQPQWVPYVSLSLAF